MWSEIKEAYRSGWHFALAFPLLFVVPALIEFVQHVVEIWIGMYVDLEGARAADGDPLRLGWGIVKTLALVMTIYWMARFKAGFDRRCVGALGGKAMRLFVPVLAVYAAVTALSLWGGSLLRPLGADDSLLMKVGIGFSIFTLFLGILLDGWKVGAALGNPSTGPLQSARMIAPTLAWSVPFSVLMMLPLMVAHYAIVPLAIAAPPRRLWLLMGFDALLVGYLAAVLAATSFIVARRAAERGQASLLPAEA